MLSPSAIDQVLCARRLHASPKASMPPPSASDEVPWVRRTHASPKASMPLPSAIDEAPMSGAAGNDSQESRVDDVTDSDMDSGPEGHAKKIESRAVGTEDTQPTSSGENRGAFQT
eukprot:s10602_g1.t3